MNEQAPNGQQVNEQDSDKERMNAQKRADRLLKFYIEDYKQKIDYLNGHFGRMWTRFNFFLAIESALFGLSFSPAKGVQPLNHAIRIAAIGILFCLVWYIFGAQDRYLVEIYRTQIERALEKIEGKLQLSSYYYVGQTKDIQELNIPNKLYQWRCDPISITKLAAYFPLAVPVVWIAELVIIRWYG